MNIIMAPDSFKGAMRSSLVAENLAAGWRKKRPGDKIFLCPLADGGEGTCEALTNALQGKIVQLNTHDALMRPISAGVGLAGDTAVIEAAAANGIELLTSDGLNPLTASSYGVGELLLEMLTWPVAQIIIGIGGSATVDGGAGMLQALGARFFDADQQELPLGIGGGDLMKIQSADFSQLPLALNKIKLLVACDVTNPLTGANGAATVFGPQKGATPKMVQILEQNLQHWFKICGAKTELPGDGAAGGIGFALRQILSAQIASGAELIINAARLPELLATADLIITGEGCSDLQTLQGKLCRMVSKKAAEFNVPCVLCSGAIGRNSAALFDHFAAVFSIAARPGTLTEAMADTAENLQNMGANLAGIFQH